MASFADMFNGFGDKLNQGLGQVTGTPLGQLGMGMLMASGPQQGNPNAGARLGQAFGTMSDMQMQQSRLQQANEMRRAQAQEMQMRMANMKQQQAQRDALKQYATENPGAFGNNPMVSAILGATGNTGMASQIAKLNPQPKLGAIPFERTQYNPDGTAVQMTIDPQTMQYKPAGAPYRPTAQQAIDVRQQQNGVENQFRSANLDLATGSAQTQAKKLELDAARVDAATKDANRKQAASQLKNSMSKNELESMYNGANVGIDQAIGLAQDLIKDPGLVGNFGIRGAIPSTPGSDAANAAARMDRFIAVSGLQGVADLKTKGINLYPMSNTDLGAVQKGVVNLNKMQDVGSAKAALQQYIDVATKAKEEGAKNYERTRSLYDLNTGTPSAASSKPVPITDDAGYNALPSGAQFTGPDGVLRRKP